MPDPIQTLTGFLASAAGALVAGYAGVLFGLAKLRRERAFEKRLDWYVRMTSVMQEMVSKSYLLDYVPDTKGRRELAEDLTAATIRFNQLSSESRLYVSERADAALWKVLGALDDLTGDMASNDPEKSVDAMEKSRAVLRYGIHELTNDVRRQFGLRTLNPPPVTKVPHPAKPDALTPPQLFRVSGETILEQFVPSVRELVSARTVVQVAIDLPFLIPLRDGLVLTIPAENAAATFEFSSFDVDATSEAIAAGTNEMGVRQFAKRSRVEMMHYIAEPTGEEEDMVSASFNVLLHQLNHVVRSYRILFHDYDARWLSSQMLPALVPWRVVHTSNRACREGLLILHKDVPYERPVLQDEATTLLAHYTGVCALEVNPFVVALEMQLDARRELKEGYYRDAVVHAQTAVESMLTILYRELRYIEGGEESEVLAELDKLTFHRLVRTEFHVRLGGVWSTASKQSAISRWEANCYRMRNRVVHAAYTPSHAEALEAVIAAEEFLGYVDGIIKSQSGTYEPIRRYFEGPAAPDQLWAWVRDEADNAGAERQPGPS